MTARAKPKRTIRVQQRHRKRTAPLPETWATRARHSNWLFGIEMAAIAAALVGIFLTAFAFRTQLEINKEEAVAREQEAIARSWELVTRRASGNSGKVGRWNISPRRVRCSDGIDLSCATMGGMDVVEGTETCARPTFLDDLDLSARTHGKPVSLDNADLSGAELKEADLSGASLWEADLSGAGLSDADLSGARLFACQPQRRDAMGGRPQRCDPNAGRPQRRGPNGGPTSAERRYCGPISAARTYCLPTSAARTYRWPTSAART